MRQILLTANIVLSAAGAASAQVVFPPVPAPAPLPPLAPPAAPVVFAAVPAMPAQAPIVTVTPFQTLEFDLASIQEQAKWAAEEGARWAAQNQNFNFNFADAQPFQKRTQVDSLYSQARGYIDSNQYDRALGPLDRVIAAKDERVDGAMYWKAYTLYKLARRDEAVATVNQLAKEFPQSPWVRDARALEVEMKLNAGQAVGADTTTDDELKLLAMNGLMRSDPDAAFPVIEKMLAGSGNVRLKERALIVLSQNRSDRARAIIANVARGNANPDLQRAAIRYLGQSNSPDAIAALSGLYRPEQSIEVRRAIINSLRQNNNNTAANNALIAIARTERDSDLRLLIARYLSECKTPECTKYNMDILLK